MTDRLLFPKGTKASFPMVLVLSASCLAQFSELSKAETSSYSRDAQLYKAAVFEEDRRLAVSDLNSKNQSLLTDFERKVVQASMRTGHLACPGSTGTNASLVKLRDGRDAVVSSAHSFINDKTLKCNLDNLIYFPNVNSYIQGDDVSDYIRRKIEVWPNLGQVNDETVMTLSITYANDFLVLPLREKPSEDILPNGTVRGYLSIGNFTENKTEVILMGKTSSFRNGFSQSYESCPAQLGEDRLFFTCATNFGSSSSAILHDNGTEFVLIGINKGENLGKDGLRQLPSDYNEWNMGVNATNITDQHDLIHDGD